MPKHLQSTVAKLLHDAVVTSSTNSNPNFPRPLSSYALISRLSLSSICNVCSTDSLDSPTSLTAATFPAITSSSSTVTLASGSSICSNLKSSSIVESKPKSPPDGTYKPWPSFNLDFDAPISP
ncbi:hypothetical protein CPC08DRAFT_770993 [Agrocybe pediades]|nr:hypothetical protein CPC08DRAFT_770993 [Agrocybe pediades]